MMNNFSAVLFTINLFEDLIAFQSKQYKSSIKKARDEYQNGEVFTHEEVFGNNKRKL